MHEVREHEEYSVRNSVRAMFTSEDRKSERGINRRGAKLSQFDAT